MKKIATLGNCQALALSWYIRRLFEERGEDVDCRWIGVPFKEANFWNSRDMFEEREMSIMDDSEGIDFLKSADYLVYQPLKKNETFHYSKIDSLIKKECKAVSIGYFKYNVKYASDLCKTQENNYYKRIRISPTYLAQKYSNEYGFQAFQTNPTQRNPNAQTNHPNVFYFLFIMKEICVNFNWQYYSEQHVLKLKENGYPFEKYRTES